MDIKETASELHDLLNQQQSISNFKKIQALYWLKTNQVKTVKEIAKKLGVHRVTVHNWLRKYREEGIIGYLNLKKKINNHPFGICLS